jgi:hypothetical protein
MTIEYGQPPGMKSFSLWLFLWAVLVVINTGCTPNESAGNDNSAALHSIGSATDESDDYQPPRSPAWDDNKGSR